MTTNPKVIAIDDWMVWARDESDRIVETCAEMWAEWLDEKKDPSDMNTEEYRLAVLRILRSKKCRWVDSVSRWSDPKDPDSLQMCLNSVLQLEIEQAAFIRSANVP